MSQRIAGALLLFLLVAAPRPTQAERATSEQQPSPKRLGLAVVLLDRRPSAEQLNVQHLISSLEACLQVDARLSGAHAGGTALGLLTIMIARTKAELIWTLPDGRTGLARVRTDVSRNELLARLTAVARSMLNAFGGTEPDTRQQRPDCALTVSPS